MYKVNNATTFDCGFELTSAQISESAVNTNAQLEKLPLTLYRSIDFKTTSSIIGAVFCEEITKTTNAIVNPIEKGHPDVIPSTGSTATEKQLRNFGVGLEIKATVGNITQGLALKSGQQRVHNLTAITWQAHHREVNGLLGMIWDFSGKHIRQAEFYYPIITGAFYSNQLTVDDWGEISGTKGRNTKVSGMRASGKFKMGNGWVILLDHSDYLNKYSNLLGLELP